MALIHHRVYLFSDCSPSGILLYTSTWLFNISWAITQILMPCLLLWLNCLFCTKCLSPRFPTTKSCPLQSCPPPEVSPNPPAGGPSHSNDREPFLLLCQFPMHKARQQRLFLTRLYVIQDRNLPFSTSHFPDD